MSYFTLMICRKAGKKSYFDMLCFKFIVVNVHEDYNPNQKITKKPNYVYYAENLPLGALFLGSYSWYPFPITKQHMLKKDQVVSFQTALGGKRPR